MKFEIGKTYWGFSLGDQDCKIMAKVTARTAKTLEAKGDSLKQECFRIKIDHDGNEYISPWGVYSLSPTINAKRVCQ